MDCGRPQAAQATEVAVFLKDTRAAVEPGELVLLLYGYVSLVRGAPDPGETAAKAPIGAKTGWAYMVCPPWNGLVRRNTAERQPNNLPPTVALAPDFTSFPIPSRDWLAGSSAKRTASPNAVKSGAIACSVLQANRDRSAGLLGKTGTDGWRGTGSKQPAPRARGGSPRRRLTRPERQHLEPQQNGREETTPRCTTSVNAACLAVCATFSTSWHNVIHNLRR